MEPFKEQIEKRLQSAFSKKKPENLYAPMFYLIKAGGKRIRPWLLLLSCKAVGGKAEACLDAAVAVELLHTFTLVHDDIMDHDNLRRGIPTVHVKWDEPTAILAGDGLVTLAYQTMLKTRHPNLHSVLGLLTDGLLTLFEGQAMDKAFESQEHTFLADYQKMIEKKTAKLFEVACEIGAVLGNARPEHRNALKQFAKRLGIAFQIQDDLLDVVGEEKVLGKPIGSDIIERKKTYLNIHFAEHATPSQKKRFARVYGKKDLAKDDLALVHALFEDTRTLVSTRRCIERQIRQSVSSLQNLPPSRAKDRLVEFALSILGRSY